MGNYAQLTPNARITAVPFAIRSERSVETDALPAGMVAPFYGQQPPDGWLLADGSVIDKGTDPEYTKLVGHLRSLNDAQGAANLASPNQAVLPDLRGVFLRGRDLGANVNPDSGSDYIGRYQADQAGPHVHGVDDPGHRHELNNLAGNDQGHGSAHQRQKASTDPLGFGLNVVTGAGTTGIAIRSNATSETRPRNITVLYMIKY